MAATALPVVLSLSTAVLLPASVIAQDDAAPTAITACLAAFGDHPFGSNPLYRTLPVGVTVMGGTKVERDCS